MQIRPSSVRLLLALLRKRRKNHDVVNGVERTAVVVVKDAVWLSCRRIDNGEVGGDVGRALTAEKEKVLSIGAVEGAAVGGDDGAGLTGGGRDREGSMGRGEGGGRIDGKSHAGNNIVELEKEKGKGKSRLVQAGRKNEVDEHTWGLQFDVKMTSFESSSQIPASWKVE
jgi:hypothetical protein